MLSNFIKVAIRNLFRNSFYTIINIIGLAIGLIGAILIGLFIQSELSFDRYHQDHDRVYRLESHFEIAGNIDNFAVTALPLAPALHVEFPDVVEEVARLNEMDNNLFEYNQQKFFDNNVFYADSTYFNLFTHRFIAGDPQDALNDPNEMVLTQSMAQRIFGSENPLGKTLSGGDGVDYTITGIIEDVPANTHLRFSGLVSMISLAEIFGYEAFQSLDGNLFWNVGFYSYIKLKPNTTIETITNNFPAVYQKYMAPVGEQINASFDLLVTPLADIHLKATTAHDLPRGNIAYIYVFGVVALFLLLIGCINYMNLATARSASRAMEVGIRKVVGAQKHMLQRQFIVESLIITFLAMIFALIAAELLLPFFNSISGKSLELNLFSHLEYLLVIVAISAVVGFASGSYPAFYLASFIPVQVLKTAKGSSKRSVMRKVLVLVQFGISIIMIIGTLTVGRQLNYIQSKDMGFNDENLMVLTIRDEAAVHNLDAFKDRLNSLPGVTSIASASGIPGNITSIIVQRYETADGTMAEKAINFTMVDHDFIDVMGMHLRAGRQYDRDIPTDMEDAMIINQAMVRNLGWDDPIGKRVDFGAGGPGEANRKTRVIGVVDNFHYVSLHNAIDPLMLVLADRTMRTFVLRLKSQNMRATIADIGSVWEEFCPNFPYEYEFLDANLKAMYDADRKIGTVFRAMSILCIVIACLGLFGLATFTAEQRTREIGIRKVMGAEVGTITLLLSSEFLKWVLLANCIAWPISYWALSSWLKNFAFRIDLLHNVWIFFASAGISLAIALLTVIFQTIKAANQNPIKALRYE